MMRMASRHFSTASQEFIFKMQIKREPAMKAAEAEIDWTRASDDSGLIEACRAAASVAAQFESAQPRFRRNQAHFNELFKKLYAAARRVAQA